MSALVILECNACGAITPPWPSADRAREEAGPDGWAVDVDGSNVDYCPQCTAPAQRPGFMPTRPVDGRDRGTVGRIEAARIGVEQLRDAMVSVANLARVRADQLLAELTP